MALVGSAAFCRSGGLVVLAKFRDQKRHRIAESGPGIFRAGRSIKFSSPNDDPCLSAVEPGGPVEQRGGNNAHRAAFTDEQPFRASIEQYGAVGRPIGAQG